MPTFVLFPTSRMKTNPSFKKSQLPIYWICISHTKCLLGVNIDSTLVQQANASTGKLVTAVVSNDLGDKVGIYKKIQCKSSNLWGIKPLKKKKHYEEERS